MRKFAMYINRWRQPHMLPLFYSVFLSVGALFTLLSILQSKSESKNAFFLGYSLEKVLLSAGLLFFLVLFLALTIKISRQPEWSRHLWSVVLQNQTTGTIILWVAFVVFISCWIILFLPFYRFAGNLAGYVSQLKPIIVWLAIVSAATMLLILLERGKESIGAIISGNKYVVWAAAVVLSLFILAGAIVAFTGVGIRHPEDYWYASGVPVLGLQILFALVIGAFMFWLESRWGAKSPRILDVLICLGLWFITAWLWSREPIRPNFFMPDTLDNIMYPYSDSATFDIGSQFALIGQGIFDGQYFDRVLYIALLTYLHMLFEQNFGLMMTAQAVVFAVFPVVIYLLGRELHSRALGMSAAVLIMLRGLNSLIASKWIDLASPKMMLTDFAAAIGIAIFTLLVLKWVKEPSKRQLAVWAGGAFGMTIMLRTNVLVLLPVLFIFAWISIRPRWNYFAVGSLLLIFGMLTATTPWDLRNRQNGTPMFYVYYYRIEEVLRARYGVGEDTYNPADSSDISVQSPNAQIDTRKVSRLRAEKMLETKYCNTQLCKISNHFFHNFITSFLILPTSFTFDDLWNTIKLSTPYWKNSWLGEGIGLTQTIFFLVNMALISLGFGAMWERNRVVSLIPVAFFLAYIFSNALALTSGGRYVVPVDWILCVYYMAGLLQLAVWGLHWAGLVSQHESAPVEIVSEVPVHQPSRQFANVISAFVMVLMFGSLIPISEMPFDRRYLSSSVDETLAMLEQKGMFDQTDFSRDDLAFFLSDPQSDILVGRMLYPRYYPAGEGEMDRHYPYRPLEYSRNVFIVIGPFNGGRQNVIIAGDRSEFISQAADVVVVGCRNELNMDGLVLFELSDPSHVYMRSPQPEWKCPLPDLQSP